MLPAHLPAHPPIRQPASPGFLLASKPPTCRDKRDWTNVYIPRNFPLPPEGCTNIAVKELVK